MRDHASAYHDFSLSVLERQVLNGSLANGLNACVECCDRWAEVDPGRIALQYIAKDFSQEAITFGSLKEQSARFANLLKQQGIGRGDVVAAMLPRVPELLVVALGIWRAGAIYQPLFTAFGPAAVEARVTSGGGSQARLIVTDAANQPKLTDVANCPPVITIDRGTPGASAFAGMLAAQSADFAPVMLRADEPFLTLFTSGTTGKPKGVQFDARMLIANAAYMIDGIDLRPEDRFWNVADPGWAYGMYYAVIGPLILGHATTFFEGAFTVENALRVIKTLGITNLAAAPTAYRVLMAGGDEAMTPISGQLRVASSAGEPLNPEVIAWADRTLKCPLRDHYGQTETGMIVNNHHGLQQPFQPGAAGLTMPGFVVAVLDDDLKPVANSTPGVLAVHMPTSPLFPFPGYFRAETPSIQGDWYLTGDTVRQEADGQVFFVGRNDDVITSSGYRIGPFDVESIVMEHPDVAEVAVIGKPDPERTEIVKAFVVLRSGRSPSDALAGDIQQLVRKRLSLHAYPREVEFMTELPKTPSGKVQRFLLRQRP